MQPPRQFATNLSPRIGHRESKLSIVSDAVMAVNLGDKENHENIIMECKDGRESLVANFKLREEMAEQTAKLEEQSAKLAQNQQAFEANSIQLREAQALHERLRMDMDEAKQREKQKEASEFQLQKENLRLQEENRLHRDELGKLPREREEHKQMQERCISLEAQNTELCQRLRSFEVLHANVERSNSVAEKEKRAELSDKDQRLRELQGLVDDKDAQFQQVERLLLAKESKLQEIQHLHERQMREKDHHLHEMECCMSDKDQTLKQLKHEHQKRDAAMQAQLHDVQAELSLAERQATAKRADDKDIRNLKQKMQDQKMLIDQLDSESRKYGSATNIVNTPGEFSRMAKSAEARGFAEDAHLAARNTQLETDVVLLRKEICFLQRRLSADICNQVSHEVGAYVADLSHVEASTPGRSEMSPEPLSEPIL